MYINPFEKNFKVLRESIDEIWAQSRDRDPQRYWKCPPNQINIYFFGQMNYKIMLT